MKMGYLLSSYFFCHGTHDKIFFLNTLIVSCETLKSASKAVLHLALQHIERILEERSGRPIFF